MAIGSDGEYYRINGFECPLDRLQILSYFIFVFLIVSYYILLVPLSDTADAFATVYAVILAGVVPLAVMCSRKDPVDDCVVNNRQGIPLAAIPGLDESTLLYCCYCKTHVQKRSKHCRACNKCVSDFDHHCKWLNNCVGGKNYRIFLILITTTSCLTAFHAATNAFVLYTAWSDDDFIPSRVGRLSSTVQNLSRQSILIYLTVSAAVGCLAFMLLFHLVSFHGYLLWSGLSTYDYILIQREAKSNAEAGRNAVAAAAAATAAVDSGDEEW
mmetsp:Transcript_80313/g.215274  ORF Transcript_80313/g.215274 Transcript_80313/m.215274 type:complete len:270 (-) Transcript_80313:131-940(-)